MAMSKAKTELKLWSRDALLESSLNGDDRTKCRRTADRVISEGGLRGDISDAWRVLGFSIEDIPQMYV